MAKEMSTGCTIANGQLWSGSGLKAVPKDQLQYWHETPYDF